MILSVTLNPALDVTYRVDRLVPGTATTVGEVRSRAGGKGINVARAAAAVAGPARVCATGLAGGPRGEQIRRGVAALGIREAFEPIAAESRQTVAIIGDRGQPTEFREPGPAVTPQEWDRFRDRFAVLAGQAQVVTMSGSLPPGLPEDAYAQLVGLARRAGARVIVDTGGMPLWLACTAGPDVVKPNEHELETIMVTAPFTVLEAGQSRNHHDQLGQGGRTARVLAAVRTLRGQGAAAVVASLGRSGSVAVGADGTYRVSHPRLAGNPVGAGDALVAGLALALANRGSLTPEGLKEASGLAMASVSGSGDVDPAEAGRLTEMVRIRRIFLDDQGERSDD
jgi:tagatose 6-phosphate kinase